MFKDKKKFKICSSMCKLMYIINFRFDMSRHLTGLKVREFLCQEKKHPTDISFPFKKG